MEELSTEFQRATELEPRDREMLEYAARLAKEPWVIASQHLDRLRETGCSDRAILEINLVASYMSFVNRVAQGLGVELEDYFRHFTR